MILTALAPHSKADCKKTPALCDRLISEAKDVLAEQQGQIKRYEEKSALQDQIISDKDAQLASPWKDPIKVAAVTTVGIVVLELVTGVLHK